MLTNLPLERGVKLTFVWMLHLLQPYVKHLSELRAEENATSKMLIQKLKRVNIESQKNGNRARILKTTNVRRSLKATGMARGGPKNIFRDPEDSDKQPSLQKSNQGNSRRSAEKKPSRGENAKANKRNPNPINPIKEITKESLSPIVLTDATTIANLWVLNLADSNSSTNDSYLNDLNKIFETVNSSYIQSQSQSGTETDTLFQPWNSGTKSKERDTKGGSLLGSFDRRREMSQDLMQTSVKIQKRHIDSKFMTPSIKSTPMDNTSPNRNRLRKPARSEKQIQRGDSKFIKITGANNVFHFRDEDKVNDNLWNLEGNTKINSDASSSQGPQHSTQTGQASDQPNLLAVSPKLENMYLFPELCLEFLRTLLPAVQPITMSAKLLVPPSQKKLVSAIGFKRSSSKIDDFFFQEQSLKVNDPQARLYWSKSRLYLFTSHFNNLLRSLATLNASRLSQILSSNRYRRYTKKVLKTTRRESFLLGLMRTPLHRNQLYLFSLSLDVKSSFCLRTSVLKIVKSTRLNDIHQHFEMENRVIRNLHQTPRKTMRPRVLQSLKLPSQAPSTNLSSSRVNLSRMSRSHLQPPTMFKFKDLFNSIEKESISGNLAPPMPDVSLFKVFFGLSADEEILSVQNVARTKHFNQVIDGMLVLTNQRLLFISHVHLQNFNKHLKHLFAGKIYRVVRAHGSKCMYKNYLRNEPIDRSPADRLDHTSKLKLKPASIPFERIQEIHQKPVLLRKIGFEVFLSSGETFAFVLYEEYYEEFFLLLLQTLGGFFKTKDTNYQIKAEGFNHYRNDFYFLVVRNNNCSKELSLVTKSNLLRSVTRPEDFKQIGNFDLLCLFNLLAGKSLVQNNNSFVFPFLTPEPRKFCAEERLLEPQRKKQSQILENERSRSGIMLQNSQSRIESKDTWEEGGLISTEISDGNSKNQRLTNLLQAPNFVTDMPDINSQQTTSEQQASFFTKKRGSKAGNRSPELEVNLSLENHIPINIYETEPEPESQLLPTTSQLEGFRRKDTTLLVQDFQGNPSETNSIQHKLQRPNQPCFQDGFINQRNLTAYSGFNVTVFAECLRFLNKHLASKIPEHSCNFQILYHFFDRLSEPLTEDEAQNLNKSWIKTLNQMNSGEFRPKRDLIFLNWNPEHHSRKQLFESLIVNMGIMLHLELDKGTTQNYLKSLQFHLELYSNSHFLMRAHPFTEYHLWKKGDFDSPQRTFNSFGERFDKLAHGALTAETVPFVYCLPEAYFNSNSLCHRSFESFRQPKGSRFSQLFVDQLFDMLQTIPRRQLMFWLCVVFDNTRPEYEQLRPLEGLFDMFYSHQGRGGIQSEEDLFQQMSGKQDRLEVLFQGNQGLNKLHIMKILEDYQMRIVDDEEEEAVGRWRKGSDGSLSSSFQTGRNQSHSKSDMKKKLAAESERRNSYFKRRKGSHSTSDRNAAQSLEMNSSKSRFPMPPKFKFFWKLTQMEVLMQEDSFETMKESMCQPKDDAVISEHVRILYKEHIFSESGGPLQNFLGRHIHRIALAASSFRHFLFRPDLRLILDFDNALLILGRTQKKHVLWVSSHTGKVTVCDFFDTDQSILMVGNQAGQVSFLKMALKGSPRESGEPLDQNLLRSDFFFSDLRNCFQVWDVEQVKKLSSRSETDLKNLDVLMVWTAHFAREAISTLSRSPSTKFVLAGTVSGKIVLLDFYRRRLVRVISSLTFADSTLLPLVLPSDGGQGAGAFNATHQGMPNCTNSYQEFYANQNSNLDFTLSNNASSRRQSLQDHPNADNYSHNLSKHHDHNNFNKSPDTLNRILPSTLAPSRFHGQSSRANQQIYNPYTTSAQSSGRSDPAPWNMSTSTFPMSRRTSSSTRNTRPRVLSPKPGSFLSLNRKLFDFQRLLSLDIARDDKILVVAQNMFAVFGPNGALYSVYHLRAKGKIAKRRISFRKGFFVRRRHACGPILVAILTQDFDFRFYTARERSSHHADPNRPRSSFQNYNYFLNSSPFVAFNEPEVVFEQYSLKHPKLNNFHQIKKNRLVLDVFMDSSNLVTAVLFKQGAFQLMQFSL